MLAVDADIVADVGAYSTHPFTCGVEPLMAATEMLGPYRVEHYRCRTRAVATNKAPMAPYRGVARPQMVLAMERLLQKAALRARARGRRDPPAATWSRPTRSRTSARPASSIDEGSYHESVELCARTLDLPAFRERQRAAREEGRLLGIGFACFAERTGYGTEAFAQRKMAITPGYDTALVRMDPSGSVLLAVGTSGHGQGHQTTLAQVAADRLGLTPDRVEVRQGDTDATPYGWGTFASRSMVVGGGATRRAVGPARRPPQDARRAHARGRPGGPRAARRRGRRARRARQERHVRATSRASPTSRPTGCPRASSPGSSAPRASTRPGTFSNACHGAIVELDPETAGVRIERYVVVEDCGVMVNPAIVEGQVRGGVAQGIAAALYEELAYGEDGQLQNASLMDYLVPTAWEIPAIEILHLETPSEFSETGAKGMGEGGTMGAPACIATAVSDALAHLGAEVDRIPITPDRLHEALREREQA